MAGVRVAASVFFLLFGEYKLAGPGFAHGGFQTYLQSYISDSAVSFYRPILSGLVLPHAVFFGYVVGVVEDCRWLVFASRPLGAPACVVGILHLLNLPWPRGGDRATVLRPGAISAQNLITCRCCCCSSFSSPRMPGRYGVWTGGGDDATYRRARSITQSVHSEEAPLASRGALPSTASTKFSIIG